MSGLIFMMRYGMDNYCNNFNYIVVQCIQGDDDQMDRIYYVSERGPYSAPVPMTAMILCHFVNAREANEAR